MRAFLRGVASILVLNPQPFRLKHKTTCEALCDDWKNVGRSFHAVLGRRIDQNEKGIKNQGGGGC